MEDYRVWMVLSEGLPQSLVISKNSIIDDIIFKIRGNNFSRNFEVKFNGNKVNLRDGVTTVDTSELNPLRIYEVLLPPPPPPSPPTNRFLPPRPSLGESYVEREFAECRAVVATMKKYNCSFVGPKGSGKSTTLMEACYTALQQNLHVVYIDCGADCDHLFQEYTGTGCFFFIDNAQNLRKLYMPNITKIVSQGKACLAFSPVLLAKSGVSEMKCYIPITTFFDFRPFSEEEVAQYIQINCSKKEWNNYTTLPYVLNQCLLGGRNYEDVVKLLIYSMLLQACAEIDNGSGGDLLKNIHSFLVTPREDIAFYLCSCGFVYKDDNDKHHLVFDKQLVFNQLIHIAKGNYELFSKYSIGGAEELLFTYHCQRAPIVAKCKGNVCYSIKGRTSQPDTLNITCSLYFEQSSLDRSCIPELVYDDIQCSLIKLAADHFAIDFIIYSFAGAKATRKLYFVQVSATPYSQRSSDKKISAVLTKVPELDDNSPYDFYKKLFDVADNNIFYIYSTPNIPHDDTFSTKVMDKKRVYFHELSSL